MRLIELWRISPQRSKPQGNDEELGHSIAGISQGGDFEKRSYHDSLEWEQHHKHHDAEIRGLFAREAELGHPASVWARSASGYPDQGAQSSTLAEPYIISGYEALAQREYAELASQGPSYSPLGSAVGAKQNPDGLTTAEGDETLSGSSRPGGTPTPYRHATDPAYRGVHFAECYKPLGAPQLSKAAVEDEKIFIDEVVPDQWTTAELGRYLKHQEIEFQYGALQHFGSPGIESVAEDEDMEML